MFDNLIPGLTVAACLAALVLLLAGCASPPVPPEVRARGEALLLELRAVDGKECCCGDV